MGHAGKLIRYLTLSLFFSCKGNIRVFGRVRPVNKEDGEGPEAVNQVTFDPDDDAILHLMHKGKLVSFELDKVFPPHATQEDVSPSIPLYWCGLCPEKRCWVTVNLDMDTRLTVTCLSLIFVGERWRKDN